MYFTFARKQRQTIPGAAIIEINKEVTEGKTMNHASVGLFNAVLMSVPVWTMIYFGIRLLAG